MALQQKNILILTMVEKYFTFFAEAPQVIIDDKVDESCDDKVDESCDDTLIKFSIFLIKKTSIERID
jgi:hypothetical protein